ncbi:response regulator transcription factor [bacterium]|nr:MAG: response regulator transcription factor [bacterium]
MARALASEGHRVDSASSLHTARLAVDDEPELVILDLGLPDGSGLTLCRELRSQGSTIPILILTAKSQVALRVEGLDAGADDYLAKPFALAELRARVRALGRRAAGSSAVQLSGLRQVRGDVVLDFGARQAIRANEAVPITARQWAILEVLASRGGRIVPRTDLLEIVWGDASESSANSLEVLIARLRKKLGADVIRTLRGEGYAFGSAP